MLMISQVTQKAVEKRAISLHKRSLGSPLSLYGSNESQIAGSGMPPAFSPSSRLCLFFAGRNVQRKQLPALHQLGIADIVVGLNIEQEPAITQDARYIDNP